MGKSPKPPKPDPRLGEAALRQAQISSEMLGLSRQQMEYQRGQDALNYALAKEQFGYQQGILNQQMDWATKDRARRESVFQPVEDRVVRDAMEWDSPENMARRAGEAQQMVQQAIGQNRAATGRAMANMGINPNSGRFAGAMADQAFTGAGLQAGIRNQTVTEMRNTAQDKRLQASQLGNPLLGASYGALTSAGQTAGSLMNPYLQANQMAIQGWQAGMGGMGQGAQANQGAFNMYNQMYQNKMDVWKTKAANSAARTGAVLGLAGAALGGPLGAGAFGAMTGATGGFSGALQGYGAKTYGLKYGE